MDIAIVMNRYTIDNRIPENDADFPKCEISTNFTIIGTEDIDDSLCVDLIKCLRDAADQFCDRCDGRVQRQTY